MQSIRVKLDHVFLDPNNFRLHGHEKYRRVEPTDFKNKMVQKRTMDMILGKGRENVRDLIGSFKANGFLKIDNILVKRLDSNDFLVVEGNRRVATIKSLLEDHQNGYDVGHLDANLVQDHEIEVVEYHFGDNEAQSYLMLMGLRHVTGIKDWTDFEQSELVYELHTTYDLTIEEISDKLAIPKQTVKKRVNTFVALKLYRAHPDYGDYFSSRLAPVFYELMGSPDIRNWLGWDETEKEFVNVDNLNRFYGWLSPDEESKDPILSTREDIRILKKLIKDPEALDILEEERSVAEALERSISVTQEGVKKAIRALSANAEKITISALNKLKDIDKSRLLDAIQTLKSMEDFLVRK